jgi:hypothetical protein
MLRIFLLSIVLAITSFILACASAPQANSNVNANIVVVSGNSNIPPEFSTTPIQPSPNSTVGIPANAVNNVPKGPTPTPGIPDPKLANRKAKPGAAPTPGIPDQETIRRQMQGLESPTTSANPNLAPPGGGMMMKKRPQPVNKPQ